MVLVILARRLSIDADFFEHLLRHKSERPAALHRAMIACHR